MNYYHNKEFQHKNIRFYNNPKFNDKNTTGLHNLLTFFSNKIIIQTKYFMLYSSLKTRYTFPSFSFFIH